MQRHYFAHACPTYGPVVAFKTRYGIVIECECSSTDVAEKLAARLNLLQQQEAARKQAEKLARAVKPRAGVRYFEPDLFA